ncbi:MAG: hypothetical protein EZS28_050423, partial [Streblomastix strix]
TTSKFMDDARSHNLQIGQMSEKRKLGKSGNSDYPIKQLYTHRSKMFSTVLSNGFKNTVGGEAGEQLILSLIPITQDTLFSLNSNKDGLFSLLNGNQQQSSELTKDLEIKRVNISVQAYMKAQPFFGNPPETMSVGSLAEAPISVPAYLSLFPESEQDLDQSLKWNDIIIHLRKEGEEEYYGPEVIVVEEKEEDEEKEEEEENDEENKQITSNTTSEITLFKHQQELEQQQHNETIEVCNSINDSLVLPQ